MLQSLGLSDHAEAVYHELLTRPSSEAAELADRTRLTPDDVHRALAELTDLGLVHPSATGMGRVRPVPPATGLGVLLMRAEAEAAEQLRRLDTIREAIALVASDAWRSADAVEVRRLDSFDSFSGRLEELAATATEECLSFQPSRASVSATNQPSFRPPLNRGVAIRSVYHDRDRHDPDTVAYVHRLLDANGEARTAMSLPMPMLIVDRRAAVFPLDPTDIGKGGIEVGHAGVLAAVQALFERVWSDSVPFGEAPTADTLSVSPVERALLRILATGQTDEAAARQLALSVRTVRRLMADVQRRLGARSRFQAGLRVAAAGWLVDEVTDSPPEAREPVTTTNDQAMNV
jgi:DNA-binding CsgD family transcriptional regulator/sugar-specific transcriptional regulator TrmB